MKFTGQQIKLGNIVLSAVTKAQKDKHFKVSFICGY